MTTIEDPPIPWNVPNPSTKGDAAMLAEISRMEAECKSAEAKELEQSKNFDERGNFIEGKYK